MLFSGKVGLVLDGNYAIISEESNENIDAQNRYLQFNVSMYRVFPCISLYL